MPTLSDRLKALGVQLGAQNLPPPRRTSQAYALENVVPGHFQATSQGDVFVVGFNFDTSVKSIKGEKRPIVSQDQRAEVLAGLSCVDYITFFDDPDPLKLIQALMPDVLVKGDDWPEDHIIGADFVKSKWGRVVRVPVVPGATTSKIIKKIIDIFGKATMI